MLNRLTFVLNLLIKFTQQLILNLKVTIKGEKTFLIFWIILGLLLIVPLTNYATIQNNYSFKQISHEQGLPGINLRDQIQDGHGIIWICIESIGLCRYDGHKFILYENDLENPSSISSNYVNKVVEDHDGYIWVATDYGLNRFDKKTQKFEVFLHDPDNPKSLPNNICRSLLVDSNGNILVGTENGLAIKYAGTNDFEHFFSNSQPYSYLDDERISILGITEHSNDIFWLATNQGLIKFFPSTGQYRKWMNNGNLTNAPIHNRILDVKEDNKGFLWLATHRGLDRFDINKETFIHWQYKPVDLDQLEQEGVNSILIDKFGTIWVATYTNGIILIDPNTLDYRRITKNNQEEYPLRSNHIRYIYEDDMGLIWIGTKFEGLFKYNDNSNVFNRWPEKYDCLIPLRNKYILSFYDDNDIYWVGTKMEGLFKVNSKTGTIEQFQHSINNNSTLTSNRVHFITRDSEANLWIGTESGLCLMNEQTNTFKSICDLTINWLCEDKNKTLWVGTTNGVRAIDVDSRKFSKYISQTPNNFFGSENYEVMYIYTDASGDTWFSTRFNGLFRYNHPADSLTHYFSTNQHGDISGNMARAIYEDPSGNIWVGTKSQGLNCYDKNTKEFKTYTVDDGLPSNMVLCIEEDKQGNLWLGTHNGVSKFNVKNKTFSNYNSDYGLSSNISEIAASHSFNSGELLFGGNNGFNIFKPEDIRQNDYIAPIIFTSIKVKEKEIEEDIENIKELKLNYKENYISFEFTLTDYNNPFRHQYSVWLEGVDNEWKSLGNRNYVSYTNLEHGHYTLNVKAANEFGNWTDEALVLKITVAPPFYLTVWFKLFSIAIILGFVALVVVQIRKRQNTLEHLIQERTQKLEFAYKELLKKNTKIREQNRQIEHHHNELEQKVAERTRDLEIAKRKAEESDRLKSSFLANMSHEIRTPLNAITGFSTLISNDIYSPERKQKYVSIIKTNATSLMKLVEDILDISKIEAEQLKIEKEFFELNSMLAELNAIFQEEIKHKRLELVKLTCAPPIEAEKNIFFNSDQIRIRQILVNLLNNAIKFTTIGKIELGHEIKENSVKFWVRDTGIGIKESDLECIFDRFTKIEENKALYRGTGLGLSISKSLSKMLGGTMWVESEINIGSCFYFEIPGEIKHEYVYVAQNKPVYPKKLNLSNKSVLIVEDEKSNYELLHSFLLSTKVEIVWAQNGKIAIDICQKRKFDFILLDIRMPEMDGYITFKYIKEILPDVPVIAQTAFAMPDDEKRINETGFNDLLIKPFSRDELFYKIKNLF